jgi:hypothetical protein
MPQNSNLSAAWQQELGPAWKDIQTRYLHTIGNLTLTGYNTQLSDRSFYEKRMHSLFALLLSGQYHLAMRAGSNNTSIRENVV